jgi:hypothetical protein
MVALLQSAPNLLHLGPGLALASFFQSACLLLLFLIRTSSLGKFLEPSDSLGLRTPLSKITIPAVKITAGTAHQTPFPTSVYPTCPIDGPSLIQRAQPDSCVSSGYVPHGASGDAANDPLLLLEDSTVQGVREGEHSLTDDAFFLAPPPTVPMTTDPGSDDFPELVPPPAVVSSGRSSGNESFCGYDDIEGAEIAADELLGDFLLDSVDWL